jgi:hypothetical protein
VDSAAVAHMYKDSIIVAVLYTSDADKVMRYADEVLESFPEMTSF